MGSTVNNDCCEAGAVGGGQEDYCLFNGKDLWLPKTLREDDYAEQKNAYQESTAAGQNARRPTDRISSA